MEKLIRPLVVVLGLAASSAMASNAELTPILEALVSLRATSQSSPKPRLTRIDAGVPLKKGVTGKRVLQLHARLGELGYGTGLLGERFGPESDAAVRAYQAATGIVVDGLVDEHTRFNLNLSDQDKVLILERQFAEMERLYEQYSGDRFVLVNVPAYVLRAFVAGERRLESKVVVGRYERQTPEMKTVLNGIVINPPWSPPETILDKDIFPGGELDRKVVNKLGLKLVDPKGQEVTIEGVVTQADLAGTGSRFLQPPGEKNALGRLKFDLDNPYGIYMHDTNHRELFERNYRAFSSGCIRVERFRELAAWVMNSSGNKVDEELENPRTRRIKVDTLPVHTVYWLAEVVDGKVVFQRDIYGRFKPR